jgi:hypothetical protein
MTLGIYYAQGYIHLGILKRKHMTLAINMFNNVFPYILNYRTIISCVPMCYIVYHNLLKKSFKILLKC